MSEYMSLSLDKFQSDFARSLKLRMIFNVFSKSKNVTFTFLVALLAAARRDSSSHVSVRP